ncbi:tRNA (adenosine(37)-N6)-dimethylallyltransferase MiaA [Tomitella cavernea]|uniref:tRNA dimethylallyltransferase n=1 Tax=Tomitella cavernea TaxID=1387982 RepID=A0ABP9CS62_9ACTN|nr:tRNA (adenosine(37)-N6)-dimethylallyltransferase MiaA [Tomitella cavernea]
MTGWPRPVAVIGPTATGKSNLALDLAERLGGEIVNIDAMQLYRGMDIGTAKTPPAQRRGVVHHQIDVLDVRDTASVAAYQCAARDDVERIRRRGRVPVIVGGSMMYVQALIDDWRFPETDPAVRRRWEQRLAEAGAAALHGELRAADPDAAAHILPTDGRRIVRALEVVEITGRPYAASKPVIGDPRWGTVMLGIDRDTADLDARIAARTRAMFADGFVEEVRGLLEAGLREGVTARRAIGYQQVIALLDGEFDRDQAMGLTQAGTRRYVRRQRSWFRKDGRVRWLDGAAPGLADRAVAEWNTEPG